MRYSTGEQPVLVECDDMHNYICKYRRSVASGYKLVSELIGSIFASHWGIATPPIAFVDILPQHGGPLIDSRCSRQICFGSRMNNNTVDVTRISVEQIQVNMKNIEAITRLALFDIWLSNEDRNRNNANLLYDVKRHEIVAIDHGCLFNTSDYGAKLSLLTESDTIINADIGVHLLRNISFNSYYLVFEKEVNDMFKYIEECRKDIQYILNNVPSEWRVDKGDIEYTLRQVFNSEWIDKCQDIAYDYCEESIVRAHNESNIDK